MNNISLESPSILKGWRLEGVVSPDEWDVINTWFHSNKRKYELFFQCGYIKPMKEQFIMLEYWTQDEDLILEGYESLMNSLKV